MSSNKKTIVNPVLATRIASIGIRASAFSCLDYLFESFCFCVNLESKKKICFLSFVSFCSSGLGLLISVWDSLHSFRVCVRVRVQVNQVWELGFRVTNLGLCLLRLDSCLCLSLCLLYLFFLC